MKLDCCKVMVAVLIHPWVYLLISLFSYLAQKSGSCQTKVGLLRSSSRGGCAPPCTWAVLVHIRGFSTTHPTGLLLPFSWGCKPGLSKAHPAAFRNGRLFESLTLNVSVSHRHRGGWWSLGWGPAHTMDHSYSSVIPCATRSQCWSSCRESATTRAVRYFLINTWACPGPAEKRCE